MTALGTDPYVRGDEFGDGFISRIAIADTNNLSSEEIVEVLVAQWLEHYQTASSKPEAAISDYTVENVRLLQQRQDAAFYKIVAGVRFSIIPTQTPSDWGGFPGEGQIEDDPWWHLSAPFGIFQDDKFFDYGWFSGGELAEF